MLAGARFRSTTTRAAPENIPEKKRLPQTFVLKSRIGWCEEWFSHTRISPPVRPEAHARGVHNIARRAITTRPYRLSGLEILKSIRLRAESEALPKVRGYLE